MKILAKLLVGFIAVAVLCAVVGIVGINQLGSLSAYMVEVRDNTIPSLSSIMDLEAQHFKIKASIRSLAISRGLDDPVYVKRQLDNIETARADYAKDVALYDPLPRTKEEEKLWKSAQDKMAIAKAFNNEIIALAEKAIKAGTGPIREATLNEIFLLVNGDRRLEFDNAITAIQDLTKYIIDHYGTQQVRNATDMAAMSEIILILVTILSFIAAALLGLLLGRNISNPLKKSVAIMDKMAAGDLSERFVAKSKDEFAQVSASLNKVADSVGLLIVDAGALAKAAIEGKLATRADATKHQGEYRKIVEGVNNTLDAVINPINVTARYVDDISKGVIPPIITDTYNGDFNIIKNNLNSVVKMMTELLQETDIIIKAAADGALDTRADASGFEGGWKQLVTGINDTITNIVNPLMMTAENLDKISAGDIPQKITTEYKGQYNLIKNNLNRAIDAVNTLVADAGMLAQAAVEGRLQTRADTTRHQGDYRKIVEGVNRTLDLVITPINETNTILKHLAEGDLTQRIASDYKGDFDVLKTSLNSSLNSINDTLSQINDAVDQVAEGAGQVSQASQALSQGATEQASSLEEITSSITEIASQTKTNTENATTVNGLARTAKDNAEKGNEQMKDLVAAMSDINTSAEEIKKVTKAIDDISFQINLLALNANVEAARAGKYGKGFAVVAEEVRNLAVRSANSVKETTRMVEEAIANIERGNNLVGVTAKQLSEIVEGSAQVASLAEEVAKAGKEQAIGLEQVSQGLSQIDQVTQANTATAEESASASEELSSQSQQVKSMLARFRLKARETKMTDADLIRMMKAELARQQHGGSAAALGAPVARASKPAIGQAAIGRNPVRKINPADVISLDDDDFGKF